MIKDQESDFELIEHYQEHKDYATFEKIAERYHEFIFRVFKEKRFSDKEAFEHTHEILVKLLDALLKFEKKAKLSTYIYKIIMHYLKCVDYTNY